MPIKDILNNYNSEHNVPRGSTIEEALQATLSSVNQTVIDAGDELPDVTSEDEGKVLKVNNAGQWVIGDDESGGSDIKVYYATSSSVLYSPLQWFISESIDDTSAFISEVDTNGIYLRVKYTAEGNQNSGNGFPSVQIVISPGNTLQIKAVVGTSSGRTNSFTGSYGNIVIGKQSYNYEYTEFYIFKADSKYYAQFIRVFPNASVYTDYTVAPSKLKLIDGNTVNVLPAIYYSGDYISDENADTVLTVRKGSGSTCYWGKKVQNFVPNPEQSGKFLGTRIYPSGYGYSWVSIMENMGSATYTSAHGGFFWLTTTNAAASQYFSISNDWLAYTADAWWDRVLGISFDLGANEAHLDTTIHGVITGVEEQGEGIPYVDISLLDSSFNEISGRYYATFLPDEWYDSSTMEDSAASTVAFVTASVLKTLLESRVNTGA